MTVDDGPIGALRADPVLARLDTVRRHRRRRARRHGSPDEPEPQLFSSWDEAFASGEPAVAAVRLSNATQLPALERWRDADVLRQYLPIVTVHESQRPTVQMSSMVQPMGDLKELTWQRPWRERNVRRLATLTAAAMILLARQPAQSEATRR